MIIFITGLNPELKSHVVLNQPTSFSEAKKLAQLREVVSKTSGIKSVTASNQFAQDQRIKELEGQVKLLMSLATPQSSSKSTSLSCIASDNSEYYQGNDNSSEIYQAKGDISATIQNSANNNARPIRNQFQPCGRNVRTTDSQPVCKVCYCIGHIARYCLHRNGNYQSILLCDLSTREGGPGKLRSYWEQEI